MNVCFTAERVQCETDECVDDDVHASQTAANDLPGSDSLEAADTSVCDTSSTDVNSPSCMAAVTSSSSTTVAGALCLPVFRRLFFVFLIQEFD